MVQRYSGRGPMSEAEELILQAGENLEMPMDKLQKTVDKIVKVHYIRTAKRLASMESKDWDDLGVPIGLRDEIKELAENLRGRQILKPSLKTVPSNERKNNSRFTGSHYGTRLLSAAHNNNSYNSEASCLPPLAKHEIEWVIEDFEEYRNVFTETESSIWRPSQWFGNYKLDLNVQPTGANGNPVFVLYIVKEGFRHSNAIDWEEDDEVELMAIRWDNWRKSELKPCDRRDKNSRIWSNLVTPTLISNHQVVSPSGTLILRAWFKSSC